MRFEKIQLINASVSESYKSFSRTGCYPPLGLIALASFIKNKTHEVTVEIIDNDLWSLDEIYKKIDSPLVGINSTILSYPIALKIAWEAKKKGAMVIIGGPYASALPTEILKNRQFVDFVAIGDGEDILSKLIIGEKFSNIPGLAYRGEKGEIFLNPPNQFSSFSPILDFSMISNLDAYFEKYEKRLKPYIGHSRSLPMYSHRGCPHKNDDGGCLFCWLQSQFLSLKTPQQFWNEISYYSERYNVKLFWDVSNNFPWDKDWLKKIISEKPNGLEAYFYIFANINDFDKETVSLLEILKCAEILIGFESNANECLNKINKGTSEEINSKAIDLFKNTDIFIYPTFVLGLPGESEKTLKKTIRFASQLKENLKIFEITCSILTPLPGSSAWRLLVKNTMKPNLYTDKDLFDWADIQKDWVENFCQISYDHLISSTNKILSLVDIDNRLELAKICHEKKEEFINA